MLQLGCGVVSVDRAFGVTIIDAGANPQRVPEDEVTPLHPALGVIVPPTLAIAVAFVIVCPNCSGHDRLHLCLAPPLPARRRVVNHLSNLHLAGLGHRQRDIREARTRQLCPSTVLSWMSAQCLIIN